ncbi:MAG: hypothetical protein Q8P67_11785 [archaeon]|nr:hypothetical protein [archaeon]
MMYNEGEINAIFFTTTNIQQTLAHTNQWDGIKLTNTFMCLNWCDSQCGWDTTTGWSTMHFFFRNVALATCPSRC